ncbi:hypothetical protein ACJJTC_000749 [Scirpophaga incertulas]
MHLFPKLNISLQHSVHLEESNIPISAFHNKTKYILLWTNPTNTPFVYFGIGNSIFIKKKCKWTNCYVTSDINYLSDVTMFEVIAFNGPQLQEMIAYKNIPRRRSLSQKYVFANIESSANYPICTDIWNEFFNWTWTYKLDSDAVWGYLTIRNSTNHIVGPRKDMHWMNFIEMDDINYDLKDKLKSKSRAVAWFASSCMTSSLREKYVTNLQNHLKKYNLMIYIYGKCGEYECPAELMPRCLKMLENKYYFYLAFENAISEDYVTEKIIYALKHNTVPIVFGGANYTRFLPYGSYLNAYKMHPENLASTIHRIIQNPTMYHNFFRWKKYYSYHHRNESPETDDYCNFCAILNNEKLIKASTVYENFNYWWTGPGMKKICNPSSNLFERF